MFRRPFTAFFSSSVLGKPGSNRQISKQSAKSDQAPSPSVRSAETKRKTDVQRWLAVSIDILEQHFASIVLQPLGTGFGVLFGLSVAFAVIISLIFSYLYSDQFSLLTTSWFLTLGYTLAFTFIMYVLVTVHVILTRERFKTIHDIIPHQKAVKTDKTKLVIAGHDLLFFLILFVISQVLSFVPTIFYYTFFLAGFIITVLLFRTIFRYVLPLILFEDFEFGNAIKESTKIFLTSDLKIINHTLIPILCIFGIGLASTSLIERTAWGSSAGFFITVVYITIYYLYYFFFGFTIDYLAYVYARIKLRIKPKVYRKNIPDLKYTGIKAIAISILILAPFVGYAGLLVAGKNLVAATEDLIVTSKLENEVPVSLADAQKQQPFGVTDVVSYRGLEFTVNSFNIASIENSSFSNICLLNVTLKNNLDSTYQFLPHLTLQLYTYPDNEKLNHYFSSDKSLTSGVMLNSYSKYLLPPKMQLAGSLAFDCSKWTGDSDVMVTFNMARVSVEAKNSNLTVDQYLDFENQTKSDEFRNSRITMIIKKDDYNTTNVSQNIPMDLKVDSAQIVTVLESRFCRVGFSIQNNWSQAFEMEFYMISLIDGNNNTRPQVYIDKQFNPENITGVIPAGGKSTFTQDFNCQDGGTKYNLTFTPYANFGPYVSQKSISAEVVIQ